MTAFHTSVHGGVGVVEVIGEVDLLNGESPSVILTAQLDPSLSGWSWD
jgi:hypothetical protein